MESVVSLPKGSTGDLMPMERRKFLFYCCASNLLWSNRVLILQNSKLPDGESQMVENKHALETESTLVEIEGWLLKIEDLRNNPLY